MRLPKPENGQGETAQDPPRGYTFGERKGPTAHHISVAKFLQVPSLNVQGETAMNEIKSFFSFFVGRRKKKIRRK